jgi:hypothetical protein
MGGAPTSFVTARREIGVPLPVMGQGRHRLSLGLLTGRGGGGPGGLARAQLG